MTESVSTPTGNSLGQAVEDPPPPAGAAFKDRRIGLVVFGIVQLLMALACLGIAGLQLVMFFAAGSLGPELEMEVMGSPRLAAFAALFYLLAAAGIAWLGIGSIQCRRWARAVTLVLSWMGLVGGVLSTVLMVAVFGSLASEMSTGMGEDNAAIMLAPMGCAFPAIVLLYILLPTAFVLFYRSPHVQATCEQHDATSRWTDGCPLPVLAGWILLLSMVGTVFTPIIGTPMPLFGALLTGLPAWIYAFVVAGLAAYLARGFFRRESWAWLGTLLFMTFNGVSAYLSFRGDGLARMYEAMNTPPEQLEAMASMGLLTSVPWIMLVSIVVMLGFYLWLGRYFGDRRTL